MTDTIEQIQARCIDQISKLHEHYTDHHHQGKMHDHSCFISDVLADIRHYCDAYGIDYIDCDRRAAIHYHEEIMEAHITRRTLAQYIADYIMEEQARGNTTIDKWMVADAIEAYEGGAQ
jgi:hypothetical protein